MKEISMPILRFFIKSTLALPFLFISHASFAGAVSGGGGGTIPADQVEIPVLMAEIESSRNLITAYLHGQEMDRVLYPSPSSPTRDHNFDKLFAPGADIFKFLSEVQIFTRDSACHDADGRETDASANLDVQGGICLSIARVHNKVSFTTYKAEIPALLLHEISHFFGTNESEAVALQKLAVRFFSGTRSSKVFDWNYRVMNSVQSLGTVTSITQQALSSGAKVRCNDLKNLSYMFMSVMGSLLDGGTLMLLTSEKDEEYYWQVGTRVMATTDYLCALKGFSDSYSQAENEARYNKIFNGKLEVSARTYMQSRTNNQDPFNRYPISTVMIKKNASVADAASALNTTLGDLTNLYNLLNQQWQAKFIVH
jgi:hypothetical protein